MDRDVLERALYMTMQKRIGEYFLDISKLIFGGVVVGTILRIDFLPKNGILITGILTVFIFSWLGFFLIKER